jgi:surfactin synthase thioesterase subunit
MVCFQHAGGSARLFPWLNAAIPPQGELPRVQ